MSVYPSGKQVLFFHLFLFREKVVFLTAYTHTCFILGYDKTLKNK